MAIPEGHVHFPVMTAHRPLVGDGGGIGAVALHVEIAGPVAHAGVGGVAAGVPEDKGAVGGEGGLVGAHVPVAGVAAAVAVIPGAVEEAVGAGFREGGVGALVAHGGVAVVMLEGPAVVVVGGPDGGGAGQLLVVDVSQGELCLPVRIRLTLVKLGTGDGGLVAKGIGGVDAVLEMVKL